MSLLRTQLLVTYTISSVSVTPGTWPSNCVRYNSCQWLDCPQLPAPFFLVGGCRDPSTRSVLCHSWSRSAGHAALQQSWFRHATAVRRAGGALMPFLAAPRPLRTGPDRVRARPERGPGRDRVEKSGRKTRKDRADRLSSNVRVLSFICFRFF